MTKRIAVITHSRYPVEPRARRMAEACAEQGYAVDVFCLREGDEPVQAVVNGVAIRRLPVARHPGAGALVYLREYLQFFLLAAWRVAREHLRRRYDMVQVHNPPDVLAFASLVPRILGARILYDVRDLAPELFMSRFNAAPDHLLGRTLYASERWACRYAHGITCCTTHAFNVLTGRGVPAEKLTIVMNCPDDRFFGAVALQPKPNGLRLVYHGTLPHRYGVNLLIRALPQLAREIPGLRLDIIGFGDTQPALEALARELGVDSITHFHGYVPLERIPAAIQGADLGVVPMRKDIFTDCGLPTKLLEYVALGIPAVVSRTVTTTEYFADDMVQYFAPDNVADLTTQILALYRDPMRAAQLAANARRFIDEHNWAHEKAGYLRLVDHLLGA
ncbi:MAG: hypothetical protein CVU38_00285 [Chloroflexi bacterium HGW-Chloroflexi-1]|nr:MAG: hypothetical protein CVU38_00285 [Chloroflexi bacterium HGW-Chloroflexi-1]